VECNNDTEMAATMIAKRLGMKMAEPLLRSAFVTVLNLLMVEVAMIARRGPARVSARD
jgi:hypothetical protein